jgi:transcription elongation GreA/GreB family factor
VSVAFRREEDDEHKEPTFELPIPAGPNLVTVRGRALIEEKADALAVQVAAEPDEERRKALGRDLRYWQTRRATAEIATAPGDGAVGFGSTVTFRQANGERTITIVGGDEADPARGLIGYQAPLARALFGAYEDEEVPFAGGTLAIVEVSGGQG